MTKTGHHGHPDNFQTEIWTVFSDFHMRSTYLLAVRDTIKFILLKIIMLSDLFAFELTEPLCASYVSVPFE